MSSNLLVAYYRVSTAKQGKSGLGLEAQKHSVESYAGNNNGIIIASFQDIESGKQNNRQGLTDALAFASKHNAAQNEQYCENRRRSACASWLEGYPHHAHHSIHPKASCSSQRGRGG